MCRLHFSRRDAGIKLRGGERAMTKQPLHGEEVRAVGHHVRCAGVPPEMGAAWAFDAGKFFVLVHHHGDGLFFQRAMRLRRAEPERSFVFTLRAPGRADLREIFAHVLRCFRAHRHDAIFGELAFVHADEAALAIDIVDGERGHFFAADSSRVKEFQDGAIADAFLALRVGQHPTRGALPPG